MIDPMETIGVELLGAKMMLENRVQAVTSCLAKSDWRPTRAHIEGMRNAMNMALDYIAAAEVITSATIGSGNVFPPDRLSDAIASMNEGDMLTIDADGTAHVHRTAGCQKPVENEI